MYPFTPLNNRDGLSNNYTKFLYEYAPSPTCSDSLPLGCNSEFLFCDLSHGVPRCSSKIKPGRCNLKCVLYEKYKKVMDKLCSSSLQCPTHSRSIFAILLFSISKISNLTHPLLMPTFIFIFENLKNPNLDYFFREFKQKNNELPRSSICLVMKYLC